MSSSEKPLISLRRFAQLLGWAGLRRNQHRVKNDPLSKKEYIVTWYIAGVIGNPRTDCFLQINESPIGQTKTYQAAVYAIRYRICTPWREFTLFSSEARFIKEAERLREWLQRDSFETPSMRKQFRASHPECIGYSWRQISEKGLPSGSRG